MALVSGARGLSLGLPAAAASRWRGLFRRLAQSGCVAVPSRASRCSVETLSAASALPRGRSASVSGRIGCHHCCRASHSSGPPSVLLFFFCLILCLICLIFFILSSCARFHSVGDPLPPLVPAAYYMGPLFSLSDSMLPSPPLTSLLLSTYRHFSTLFSLLHPFSPFRHRSY